MTLYLLNLADLYSTLIALSLGLVELNPLIDFAISVHPALFAVLKLAAFPLCRWLRDKKSSKPIVALYAVTVGSNLLNIAAVMAAF